MRIGQGDGLDLGLESKQFTMKTNAKAFAILSSGLYSNKIRAVIRELSCNAHDSHIEAGNENTPFDVQLPGYNNKQFFVRDYGTGLTEEEIYNVYTTYFESTKSDSNDYTGALGLGSKSPFCMATEFTIEAFKDNVRRTFLAYIGKSGMPELSKLSEAETNEPNGLKVTVDVNDNFHKWNDEATDLFAWFPVQPNVICENTFTHKIIEKVAKLSDTVNVLNSDSLAWSERVVITQGTVAYPLRSTDLNTYFQDYDWISGMHLQFEVPIGSVDITASRESLSFVDYTVENLKAEFDKIKDLVQKEIDAKLAECEENPWKLLESIAKLRKVYPYDLIKKSTLITDHSMAKIGSYSGIELTIPDMKYIDKKKDVVTVMEYTLVNNKIRTNTGDRRTLPDYNSLKANSNVHFVVNNTTRGLMPTLRLFAAENKPYKIVVIEFTNKKKYNTRVVNSVLKDLQNPVNVHYADKMKRPVSKTNTARGATSKELTVKRLHDKTCQYTAKWHKELFDATADNLYFVDLANHTIMDNDYYKNINSLISDMKKVLPGKFFENIEICGMTKTQKKLFKKQGVEVKSLFTLVEEYVNDMDFVEIFAKQNTVSDAPGFLSNSHFRELVSKDECKVPEIVELVDILQAQRGNKEISAFDIKRLVRSLKLNVNLDVLDDMRDQARLDSKDMQDFALNIEIKCPMIKYFNPGYYGGEEAYRYLMDYINNQYA